MLESNIGFSLIGKAMQPNQEELILETDNEGIFLHSEIELDIINQNKCRRQIGDFISSTVIYSLYGAGVRSLHFETDEGKKCKAFLKQHFGEKHDSVTRFFKYLENAGFADTEKFAKCVEILDRREIKSIPKFPGDTTTYFLVMGVFFEPPIEDRKKKKLFLQKVFTYDLGYTVTHEELSKELYHISQLSHVKGFFTRS